MKSLKLAAAAAGLLLLAGCYTVSYRTNRSGGGVYKEERGDYFLWGLVGEQTVSLKQLCPDGVSRFRSVQTPVDGFLGIITLGIYIPRHVKVECAGAAHASAEYQPAGDEPPPYGAMTRLDERRAP